MSRIVYFVSFVLALGTIGCGSGDNHQENKTAPTVTQSTPAAGQPKPVPPTAEVPPRQEEKPAPPVRVVPASAKRSPPGSRRVRDVAAGPSVQDAEDSQRRRLATEVLRLSPEERLEWTRQEFAKREIADVRDDQ